MIISTGMRTDIPAFFSEWFANRIREGYVCTRNPYNPGQVTRYRLTPDVVDLFTFCTKNPAPMFRYMDLLEPYGQYWFVTITPYGSDIEPNVPQKEKVLEDFKTLSGMVGADCIGWRYDPIFLSERYSIIRHIEEFEKMAAALSGYTRTCVISFIDLYKKVRKNFPKAKEVGAKERLELGKEFVRIGARYGLVIRPCAEGNDLEPYGADCGGCMTLETYETALRERLCVPNRRSPRAECACLLGNDIGSYDTCGHLCRYCYANADAASVRRNMRAHDPRSPFLIGGSMEGDIVHEAEQVSWIDRQLRLF